jgi:hypothetical protein
VRGGGGREKSADGRRLHFKGAAGKGAWRGERRVEERERERGALGAAGTVSWRGHRAAAARPRWRCACDIEGHRGRGDTERRG